MITDFSFGRIVVEGRTCSSDIKIVLGKLVTDWWRRSGHSVEMDDVQDILASDPEILVIGRGQPGFMRVSKSLKQRLERNNIQLIEEPTSEAVRTFNSYYSEGKKVAGGFHVSC
jgi:hypothetical protein